MTVEDKFTKNNDWREITVTWATRNKLKFTFIEDNFYLFFHNNICEMIQTETNISIPVTMSRRTGRFSKPTSVRAQCKEVYLQFADRNIIP